MRLLTQHELLRLTRTELAMLQRRIAGELAILPEHSAALANAHANLQLIRRTLARHNPAPRP